MTRKAKLSQLLSHQDISDWLAQFIMLDGFPGLAVFGYDGSLFAQAGDWPHDLLTDLQNQMANEAGESGVTGCQLYPLQAAGAPVGTLVVRNAGSAQNDAVPQIVRHSLELLLNEAAEKRALAAEAHESTREISLLYRIGETISATLDPHAIPGMILEQSRQIIEADAGVVVKLVEEAWQTTAAFGQHQPADLPDLLTHLSRNHHQSQQAAVITRAPSTDTVFGPLLWAPMTTATSFFGGILLLRRNSKDAFDTGEKKLLQALARQAAVALSNAFLFDEARTYAQYLQELNRISREMMSSLDIRTVIERILDSAIALLHAEAGSLFLVEGPDRDLVFSVVRDDTTSLEGRRLPAGTGIVGNVADTGQARIVNHVDTNAHWYKGVDEESHFVTRSIIAVPMMKQGVSIGVVELVNKRDGLYFERRDVTLLEALAAQAVIALENARLHQSELVVERMEHELKLGFEMQAGLIPAPVPTFGGWQFAAWWQPAREVSGDFYDFIHLPDRLGVVIADVADKGVHAALFMALTRSLVRASVMADQEPAEDLNRANSLITDDAEPRGMFVTLFYAEFAPDGSVTFVNAGHNPPLHRHVATNRLTTLEPTGIFLGFESGVPLTQETITFKQGDFVVLFTDGITEAMNAAHEQFGSKRLRQVLLSHQDSTAEAIRDTILAEVRAFVGDTDQSDDITLVVAKRIQ